jgi:hypothetical protein
VQGIVTAAVTTAIKPTAAVAVASTFTFPLALMILVLLFLVIQSKLDRRDPRLRVKHENAFESTLAFEDEDLL